MNRLPRPLLVVAFEALRCRNLKTSKNNYNQSGIPALRNYLGWECL
jgi:hypothetical protein